MVCEYPGCGKEFVPAKRGSRAKYCTECKSTMRQLWNRQATTKRASATAIKRASLICADCSKPISGATRSDTLRCVDCAYKQQLLCVSNWGQAHKEDRALRARERRGSPKTGPVSAAYEHKCAECSSTFMAYSSKAQYCDNCITAYRAARESLAVDHKRAQAKARHLQRNYGITVEDYNQMLRAQNNRCALCATELTTSPHVEHHHATKLVRGIVCRNCNIGLRYLDDETWMVQAQAYLTKV